MKRIDYKTAEGILFTDQYQLTMAQLYYQTGFYKKDAQFDYFFRNYPDYGSHRAGYCVLAGLEWLLEWMQNVYFRDDDIEFLSSQTGNNGDRLFKDDFLNWLKKNGNFDDLYIRAIPEGRVVHANTPLITVQGPLAMAQIFETALLNHMNYQTLIATKAARIRYVSNNNSVLEFGARRAPGKGANAAARAALIGGADFSSNTGISYVLGYPPKGTHAHSMVQAFMALGESELDAFRAYADVYPDDCLLLVDTIDTLKSGIPNAIRVFQELKKKGHKPMGVRLDSGDLAYLAIEAAKQLNRAGFKDEMIVLSNELDELNIWQIVTQIQKDAVLEGEDPDSIINRLVFGVGTRLVTSKGDPALGGVYKLVAMKEDKKWLPAIKISESIEKIPNPGNKQVWRIYDKRNKAIADLIGLESENPEKMDKLTLHHPTDSSKTKTIEQSDVSKIEPLGEDIFRQSEIIHKIPSIEEMRKSRQQDMERLDSGVQRLINPHIYHVSLTQKLWEIKQDTIAKQKAKEFHNGDEKGDI